MTVILLGLVIGLGYGVIQYVLQPDLWPAIGIALGVWLGVGLMFLDELVLWRWYQADLQPDQPQSPATPSSSMFGRPAGQSLITRSLLFMMAYVLAAIFVITSSGNTLGQGFVLGIGLVLSWELWQLANQPAALQQRFLWQVKRQWLHSELIWLPRISLVVLVVLSLWCFT